MTRKGSQVRRTAPRLFVRCAGNAEPNLLDAAARVAVAPDCDQLPLEFARRSRRQIDAIESVADHDGGVRPVSSIDERTRDVVPGKQGARDRLDEQSSEPATHSRARKSRCAVHRYYDSSTCQFLTVDPALAKTGQPYAFAGNNPINATDPTGLDCGIYCTPSFTVSIAYMGSYVSSYSEAQSQGSSNPAAQAAVSAYLTAKAADATAVDSYLSYMAQQAMVKGVQAAESVTAALNGGGTPRSSGGGWGWLGSLASSAGHGLVDPLVTEYHEAARVMTCATRMFESFIPGPPQNNRVLIGQAALNGGALTAGVGGAFYLGSGALGAGVAAGVVASGGTALAVVGAVAIAAGVAMIFTGACEG